MKNKNTIDEKKKSVTHSTKEKIATLKSRIAELDKKLETVSGKKIEHLSSSKPEESRLLLFRCAVTGERFSVLFRRYSPLHKFQIVTISPQTQSGEKYETPTPDNFNSTQSFEVEEFDLSGWYCPHCQHAKHGSFDFLFIHCHSCGEYVCGARGRKIGAKAMFACHDGCGNTGPIEGRITRFTGTTLSVKTGLEDKGYEGVSTTSPKQISALKSPFLSPPKK